MVKKLSDIFGINTTFVEEEFVCQCCDITYTFYDTPKPISESISVRGGKKIKKILGIAEGVFSILDGTSRNNRFYPESFWKAVVLSEDIQKKIASRRMLGTIGHYDKKIDTEDFAKGLISHVITELRIDESNGVVWGRIEILDTDAGRKLKECYDADLPMYISSRGAGKLQPSLNSNLMRVDEKYYYLEGYDIVWDPGFLQAKPVYKNIDEIGEDLNEEKLNYTIYDKNEEIIMERKELLDMSNIDMKNGLEALIKELLAPLQEDNASVKSLIENLQVKIEENKEDFMKMIEKKKEEKEDEKETSEEHKDHPEDCDCATCKKEDEKETSEEKKEDEEKDDKKEDKEETSEEVNYKKIIEELKSQLSTLEKRMNASEENEEELNIMGANNKDREVTGSACESDVPEEGDMKGTGSNAHPQGHVEMGKEKADEAEKTFSEGSDMKGQPSKEQSEELTKVVETLTAQVQSLEEEKKDNESYKEEIKVIVESIKEITDKTSLMAEEYVKNKEELNRVTEELSKVNLELTARQISEECGITIEDARVRLQDKSVDQIKEEVGKEKDDKEKEKEEDEKKKLEECISSSVSESNEENKQKPLNRFISESKETLSDETTKTKPSNRFK